jgi:hypothetical protein
LLPYKAGALADAYAITTGSIGAIGLKSADQDGDIVTFTFDKLLCAGQSASRSNTTFFFGLAAAKPPKPISAGIFGVRNPPYLEVSAQAPSH